MTAFWISVGGVVFVVWSASAVWLGIAIGATTNQRDQQVPR